MEKYEQGRLLEDRTIASAEIVRFGERLREAMKGMSNVELAKRSGLSEGSIRKYIKGESYPSIDNAALVADACGVSLIWLLCGFEVRENQHNSTSEESDDFRDLLTIFKSLSIAERKSLLHLLGRKGSELLAQLLNEDNLCLMQLSGEKREAALILAQLVPERVREILSELRASRDMAGAGHQQDVDDQHKGVA
ncbi:helix-turn-helix domain-containing protein [Salmonella enterica subsp. enterica serovar Bispebjerg]|uniref:Helix-turn-helix domain-containing protein n=1 Tax=Salmonella enterica TaxID=28901 RepID=A0A743PBC1_SALER|nr:helix-turn-helix domain-containing protein [Salmonella enterica]WBQ81039.1 helix-turn-helix domain-containing protein [Salmonella enterica subsp. enterica serovar Bispebjerg]HAF2131226.1 helix-turn-helix domain-containing protein [Salmonella enterica]